MGPLLGSVLYSLGGYSFAFFFFGAIFMIFSVFIKKMLPEKIDGAPEEHHHDDHTLTHYHNFGGSMVEHDSHIHTKKEVGYISLLTNARFLFAALSGTIGYFVQVFFEPILAVRLSEFKLEQYEIGLFFTILPVFYIISSISVQYIPRGI